MKLGAVLSNTSRQFSDLPPLHPRQVWVLLRGLRGFAASTVDVGNCPGGVELTTVNGLIKRGLMSLEKNLIYRTTREGHRAVYAFAYVFGMSEQTIQPADVSELHQDD